jgi:hypothetical protein
MIFLKLFTLLKRVFINRPVKTILIIDDEIKICEVILIAFFLEAEGYRVMDAQSRLTD